MPLHRVQLSLAPLEEGGAPAEDELVSISRRELDDLRAQVAASRTPIDPPTPKAPSSSEVDRTSSGEDEPESRGRVRLDERTAHLERAYRSALLERELATSLASKPLVPGAVSQLVKLWREDFDVYEDDGTVKIASRDGRTVAEVVNDRLSAPEYSHFHLARTRGGTGSQGAGHRTGPSTPVGPKSLGESILNQWLEAGPQARTQGGPSGWGRSR